MSENTEKPRSSASGSAQRRTATRSAKPGTSSKPASRSAAHPSTAKRSAAHTGTASRSTAGKRRKKKHVKKMSPGMIALFAALALIILTLAILLVAGMRYQKKALPDGTIIKFSGTIRDGTLVSGSIHYENGNVAQVTTENGTTTVKYATGDTYIGKMQDFMQNDPAGKYIYRNGDVYEGSFVNDKMTGSGTFTYVSGDSYAGEVKDGKMNGRGTYTFADGSSYVGTFKDDLKDGSGTYIWADGTVYVGDFVNDVKTGQGEFTLPSGDTYKGAYENDLRSGKGTYTWASGDTYTGDFSSNLINGWGTYHWANGREYEGLFENGKIVRTTTEQKSE